MEVKVLFLIDKLLDIRAVPTEQRSNLGGCTVAQADPDNLRRGATQDAEPMKVLIFRDEHASVLERELPDLLVGRSASAK
jgi:hypothetical protein